MKSIVTVTMNPALDMFLEVPWMKPDRKLRCSNPTYAPGGGGVNVSRAIRRLGSESTALFPAGGWSGDRLLALLDGEGVATNVIRVESTTRHDIAIMDRGSASEYIFILPGSELRSDEWEHCLRAVRSISPAPDYVVASGSLPPGVPVDFYARLAALAREVGFRLIVDTSGRPLSYAAAEGTFLLKPNLSELSTLSEAPILTTTAIEGAARAIVAAGRAEVVVVSAGAAGALLVTREGAERIDAPVVPIVSRVGAGDSMVAGITLALARGWSIRDSVRFGVAAGSAAVTAAGHQLCNREETEKLFEAMRQGKSARPAVLESALAS